MPEPADTRPPPFDISPFRELYPFRSRFLAVGPWRCHYVDEGEGQPILMVHGNPAWSFLYRALIKGLRGQNRVVAVDNLGCGLSDKPQAYDYCLDSHVGNLEAVVARLGLKGITLVGHDWGGAIAMGLARRSPDNIKRIILMNTAAFSARRIPFRIALCRLPVLGPFLVRRLNLFSLAAVRMAAVKPLPPLVRKAYLAPYDSYANRVAVYNFIKDIPVHPEHESYDSILGIETSLWIFRNTPACLIWGMRDWVFTETFLRRMSEFFPRCRVRRMEDAGHWLLEDEPFRILSYIKEFFADFP